MRQSLKGIEMIITSIEKSKKNKERIAVYVDNQYCFSISEADYISLNLYEEKELTKEDIENVKYNVNFKAAKSSAVKYISLRVRTGKDVRFKLNNEGFESETVEKVIEELQSIGYVNDKIYAQKYVFDRSKLKPMAKKMLRYELLSKGVEDTIINEVLDGWEVDEYDVAETLFKRKFGKYDLSDEKVRRKAISFLLHRGYSFELIDSIISGKSNNN